MNRIDSFILFEVKSTLNIMNADNAHEAYPD